MDSFKKLGLAAFIAFAISVAFWVNFGLFLAVHGNTFYHSAPYNAQRDFTSSCKENQRGGENGVPDTHTSKWTCILPNGPTR